MAVSLVLPSAEPPDPRGAEGLRIDLERIISMEENGGWFLDASHYESMHPTVLQSVCRASVAARRLTLDRLNTESQAAGDPRVLYDAAGRMTSEVEHALHLLRMRVSLDRATKAECPFWVQGAHGYDGRQTDRNRFTLNAETGGVLQLRYAADKLTVGAGPSIRLLAGYSFGHVAVLAGPEFAGGPMIRDDDRSKLVLNYFPALPVVVRVRGTNWIYTAETGLVTVLQANNTSLGYGIRAGGGIGLMALRTRYFIPWAGIAAYYEHYFEGAGRPAAELLRGGFRVGIIYDP